MKQVTIISGKGGAGKTTITASLLSFIGDPVIVDCDVDASNLNILLNPEIQEKEDFQGLDVARINEDLCDKCGNCRQNCRFQAISKDMKIEAERRHRGAEGTPSRFSSWRTRSKPMRSKGSSKEMRPRSPSAAPPGP